MGKRKSMDKKDFRNYKKNNLKLIYKNFTAGQGCAVAFPFKKKMVEFLNNFTPERLYYKVMKTRFLLTRKAIMPCLQYIVTTKCTMNCKQCNTFIPYFTEKTHLNYTTFEQFKSDLDKLLKSIDYVDYFGLVGGEVLLTKDLNKMLKYALSKRKLHHVFIATNGTILPSSELIKTMKNKKFCLQLSDYRKVTGLRENVTIKFDEFKKLLKDNNITFITTESDNPIFFEMPKLYKDTQDKETLRCQFDKCWGQYCNMICDGIITQCTLSVYISRNFDLSDGIKGEIVDIRKEKSPRKIADKIIQFYAKPYSEFCHYCHPTKEPVMIPRAEQL